MTFMVSLAGSLLISSPNGDFPPSPRQKYWSLCAYETDGRNIDLGPHYADRPGLRYLPETESGARRLAGRTQYLLLETAGDYGSDKYWTLSKGNEAALGEHKK